MRDPEQFDAFYSRARERLLLQTYALTGDLPAARGAVRDAFVAAWHHWHKVSRQDDPEAWVRPHAWSHAQRKHTTHFWHRDRSLAPDHRATLQALAELPHLQRRALLLHALAGLPVAALAVELGITAERADRQLRLAIAQFAIHRDVPPVEVAAPLLRLAERTDTVRLPRTTIIRRSGTARRRAHTSAAVAAVAAVLVAAGIVVGTGAGVSPSLAGSRGPGAPGGTGTAGPVLQLDPASLLTSEQLAGAAGQPLTMGATGNNTDGTGLNLPCQEQRFADPKPMAALVRGHLGNGAAPVTATQVVERSADEQAAAAAYETTLGWFSRCGERRVQLLSSYALTGTGDAGALLVLRDWGAAPVTTYSVGVVRTGSIVTSLLRTTPDDRGPDLPPFVAAVGASAQNLCGADGGGTCPTAPQKVAAAPPVGPMAAGFLQPVDLPPVGSVARPWVGTDPEPAATNPAATTCDRATFAPPATTWSATRTFLIPGAALPTRFGLSETVGRFADDAGAQAFTAGVKKRVGKCEDRDLSATVSELARRGGPATELATWKFTTKISDKASVDYYVALVRRGPVVAQVTFVPAKGAVIQGKAFASLAERALARLENLPPA